MSATAVKELQSQVEELSGELERIAQAPLPVGTVLATGKTYMLIAAGGAMLRIGKPKEAAVASGDSILLHPKSMQYVDHLDFPARMGELVPVTRELDGQIVEISINGMERTVLRGSFGKTIKEGDKVVLDTNGMVIVAHYPNKAEQYIFTASTNVTWDDIGGAHDAKLALIEAVELPRKYPELYKGYGKRPIKGVLLEGPPGCGKTMLGKALATAVGGTKTRFIYIKGAELLNEYVGVTESRIRDIFADARFHQKETGTPAVIFIDEADALLGSRSNRHAFMEKTVVPTFLAEMDGLDENGAIVVVATNRASSLDSAITREGRMDRKIRVSRPDIRSTLEIARLAFSTTTIAEGHDVPSLASTLTDALFAPEHAYYDVAFSDRTRSRFCLSHLVSGALIVGAVEHATSNALHRDLAAGSSKASGVLPDDVHRAVKSIFIANTNVDHSEALTDFAGPREIAALNALHHTRTVEHVETAQA
jgi:proteasome-associated ATPase